MRRTTSRTAHALATAALTTASLGAAAVLTAAPSIAAASTAAADTCRGQAATIVGTTPTLRGTDGPDVIVTGSSTDVLAGAGDDLVCVTGQGANSNFVGLDAGPGDDLVDTTGVQPSYYVSVVLGEGSDTFVGGASSDAVVAGPATGPSLSATDEAERDVIDTGAGYDRVTSGGPGLANDDEVRTGGGGDFVTWSGTMGPTGVLDLGEGLDRLMARASGARFSVDLAARTITRDGVRDATFTGVDQLAVTPEPGLGTLAVLGSPGEDDVLVTGPASVQLALGAGDDRLDLAGARAGSLVDLGTDRDLLTATSREGSIGIDLVRGTLAVDGASAGQVAGVEDVRVSALEARIVGDDRRNVLAGVGCRVVVDGRGGRDEIRHDNYDADADEGYDCDTDRVVLRGGSGNDVIDGSVRADRIYGGSGHDRIDTASAGGGTNKAWGGPGNDRIQGGGDKDVLVGGAGRDVLGGKPGNDVLLGGPGRDRATGSKGRDRCRAEVERACER